ncbi:MAG: hypothetical protein JWM56_1014 [Candidatus Peribacteria bacterium]|nr:hypothetical protein [Candidatus Peribacteria bacterium]
MEPGVMKDLSIRCNPKLEVSTDAFGVRIVADEQVLEVPVALFSILEPYNILHASDLLDACISYSAHIGDELGWNSLEMGAANASLALSLAGHVERQIYPHGGFGYLLPEDQA